MLMSHVNADCLIHACLYMGWMVPTVLWYKVVHSHILDKHCTVHGRNGSNCTSIQVYIGCCECWLLWYTVWMPVITMLLVWWGCQCNAHQQHTMLQSKFKSHIGLLLLSAFLLPSAFTGWGIIISSLKQHWLSVTWFSWTRYPEILKRQMRC